MPDLEPRTRLLFVTSSLQRGGAERHVATVVPALDRDRIEARVLCTKSRGEFFDDLTATGVPAASLESGNGKRGLVRTARELVAAMRRWRPDVVMTNGFDADVLGRIAARVTRVPVVVAWKHNCGHLGRYGRRDRLAEAVLGRLVTRYFAVAHGQRPYLVDYLRLDPDKIRVLHNAIPPSPAPLRVAPPAWTGLSADDLVVVNVSVLRAEKDHASLLRAMRTVVDREPRARLLIVGDGPERGALSELTQALELDEHVVFAGDRADVPQLLACAHVFALASYTVECLPYTVLEAMDAALPVVATRVGGLPELVDHGVTGYLVPPRDHEALAAGLLDVVVDPALAESMGHAGRARLLDDFDFDSAIQEIEREIEGISPVRTAFAGTSRTRNPS